MAYTKTYTFKYTSSANIRYILEFHDQGTNASTWANEKGVLGSDNCQIDWGSENAKMYSPLKPSTMTIDFMVTDQKAALYLKTLRTDRQERDVYVYLYNTGTTGVKKAGESPIFAGYLLMDLSDDPDVAMPFPMKLRAIDGLASLKYYDFIPHSENQRADHLYTYAQTWKPGNNNTFDTFYPFTQWISRILQYTGYATTSKGCETNAEFQTSVNWYNSNMANLTGDPLNWTRALADQFYTAEGDTGNIKYKPLNCYDALQFICKTWGMRCFVYRNTFYFIGINTYTATNSGTLASPENINFHRYTITGSTATPATGDALDLDWGRYHIPVHLTTNNKKIAGSQYGILPAFKRVSVDFFNISNINYFQGFPKIPQPYPVSTGSGVMYNEETIGTFDFDGTNQRTFFQQIYLDFQNNSGGDIRYEFRWHIQAKKVGTSTWYQFGYNNWSSSNMLPNWFSMAGIPQNTSVFGRGHLIVPPGASSYNIVTDVLNAPWNGTNINSYVECPATVFSAGDWEFKYVTVTQWFSGSQNIAFGQGRCDPIPNPGTSYLKDPDSNFITYTDSTILQGAGASMFSPITNGVIGTETTTTQIVQSGSDTEFEEVTDVLWGDLPGAGAGRIQVYTGTGWVPSGFLGTWGIDTLSGGNSLAETLCEEIFKRQAKNVRKFSTKINLDAEDIYQIDSSGSRAMYSAPFTKWFTPSHFSSATFPASWIMHTGNFDTGADTWGLTLYEFETFSVATTTTTTGTNGSNSGGTGTNGSTSSLPNSSGGVGKTFANPTRNNSRAIAQLRQNATRPLTVVTTGQGLTSEGTLTVTSLTVQAIPKAVLKAGDIILLMCAYQPETTTTLDETNTIEYGNVEFEVSSDQSAGDTTISVTSKTIYQIISIGDVVTISQPDLMAQYQNKTRGTVGGFDITATSIDSGSVAISSYIDDDTFATASATSLATSESIKAYVDPKGEKSVIQIRNDEGITIPAGAPIYSKGEIGGSERILVGISDAGDSSKMPCIGIVETELNTTDNKDGFATTQGVFNTNISGFTGLSEGDILYVNSGSAPYLTQTKPTNGDLIQNVGVVIKTNGTICQGLLVAAIGRTNDVPWPLYVDHTNQRVSIGTTTPADLLHIADTSSTNALVTMRTQNSIGYAEFGTQSGYSRILSGGYLLYAGTYGVTYFYVNASTAMTLNSTGLGIGTSSPSVPLEVYSSGTDKLKLTDDDGSNVIFGIGGNLFSQDLSASAQYRIRINNSEKIRLDSAGNLGINTAFPSEKLHVVGKGIFTDQVTIPATPVASTDAASKGYVDAQIGANNDLQEITDNGATTTNDMTISNGAPAMILKDSTSGSSTVIARNSFRNNVGTEIGTIGFLGDGNLRLTNILSNNITFYTSNAEKMRITSGGNLGLGVTSVGAKLDMKSSAMSTNVMRVITSDGSTGAVWFEDNSGDLWYQMYDASANEKIRLRSDSSSFFNGGNVGIGQTSPAHKLDVAGYIRSANTGADSNTKYSQFLGRHYTNSEEDILAISTESTSSSNNIYIGGGFSSRNSATTIKFSTASNNTTTTGSERMRVTNTGNVLIGTTTDSGHKLQVNGDIQIGDNDMLRLGDSSDLKLYHTGTGTVIQNAVGNLTIQQDQNDGDIVFRCDDGSGGTTEYFRLDGSETQTRFFKNVKFNDSVQASFGTANDLRIHHNGTDSVIDNVSGGDLYISQKVPDKDLIFRADDGTGGFTEYFRLDGGYSSPFTIFPDGSNLAIGSGLDLRISHSGTDSFIDQTGTGDLYIRQKNDGKDIILQSDDGTGGTASYITLDGSQTTINLQKTVLIGTTTNTGAYKIDVAGKQRVQDTLELDDVLMLNAISTPSDPAAGKSVIYMDSSDGGIKCKINVGGTVVERTIASFE